MLSGAPAVYSLSVRYFYKKGIEPFQSARGRERVVLVGDAPICPRAKHTGLAAWGLKWCVLRSKPNAS